jgi:hypothetical protein
LRNNLKGVKKGKSRAKAKRLKKGAWDQEVFKTFFTSFWLKDIFFTILFTCHPELVSGSQKRIKQKIVN